MESKLTKLAEYIQTKLEESWTKMGSTGSEDYVINDQSYWFGYYRAMENIEALLQAEDILEDGIGENTHGTAVAVVCTCGRTVKFSYPLKMNYEDLKSCLFCGAEYLPCYTGAVDTPVVKDKKQGCWIEYTGEVIY